MIPQAFDYVTPKSLNEAIRALSSHGEEAKILAGGHSLLPMMKLRLANPKLLIDISRISELVGIREDRDKISIGPLTTHYRIESSKFLRVKCPLLPRTAGAIGDVQVRNRGTIGGSLVHADPAADLPAAILALGGELKLSGPKGERWLPAENFFLGLMTTAIDAAEILTEIRVPVLPQSSGTAYVKVPQKASGFAIVGVAVWLRLEKNRVVGDLGIGVTGVDAQPFRAQNVENRLRGKKLDAATIEKACAQVTDGVEPLDDIHASAEFRTHLARLYCARAIHAAATR